MKNFYPPLRPFLFEEVDLASTKIDDYDYVKTKEGNIIDMKFLRKEMESAKTAIVSQSPLFSPYVHKFHPIYTWYVPTMATDGVRLFVNPKFANELTWEQKIFVIIHEIMHCVLLHQKRVKQLDPKLFNKAADYEINPIIVDTLSDFDEAFVRELRGLYDIKYLNVPAELIYAELKKTAKPSKPPKAPPAPPQPIKIEPGMKVRIKATKQIGVVKSVNADGTYDIDPINESLILGMLLESFKREEFHPIMPKQKGGSGGGGSTDDDYEEEEGDGEDGDEDEGDDGDQDSGKGKGKGKNQESKGKGKGKGEQEGPADEPEDIEDYYGGGEDEGPGSVMDSETGKRIAKASGYDESEMGSLEDSSDSWGVEGAKLIERMEKSNPSKSGSGKGNSLLKALYRIHKPAVDWKGLFKRYVATALSPEVEVRIGNKKHLGSDVLRYGEKSKYDALSSIVVCVDVSGSMGKKALENILNEINNIIFSKKVNKITILFFDDGVDDRSVQTIKRMGKPWMPGDISGGGGTSFQKPLDWIKKHLNDRVSLCVFFTDGGAANPKRPIYANKFIWVVYENPGWEQPFGRLVRIDKPE